MKIEQRSSKKPGLDRFFKSLKDMEKEWVLVGIPGDGPARQTVNGNPSPTNAQIGYIMEKGSPAQNIPARPHLVPGVKAAKSTLIAISKAGLPKAILPPHASFEPTLRKLGQAALNSVRNIIAEGDFAPLSAATIAGRAGQRGARQTTVRAEYADLIASGASALEAQTGVGIMPLQNTGQYRNAFTYVVKARAVE